MFKKLIKLANKLDQQDFKKQANKIDSLLRYAVSVLKEDENLQDIMDDLIGIDGTGVKGFYECIGKKERKVHPRARERAVKKYYIPAYRRKSNIDEEKLQETFEKAKNALSDTILEAFDRREEWSERATTRYLNQIDQIDNPDDLIDWYHTFIAREELKIQKEWNKEVKRDMQTGVFQVKEEDVRKILKTLSSRTDLVNHFSRFRGLMSDVMSLDEIVAYGNDLIQRFLLTGKAPESLEIIIEGKEEEEKKKKEKIPGKVDRDHSFMKELIKKLSPRSDLVNALLQFYHTNKSFLQGDTLEKGKKLITDYSEKLLKKKIATNIRDKKIFAKLISLADKLDQQNFKKQANQLDIILKQCVDNRSFKSFCDN